MESEFERETQVYLSRVYGGRAKSKADLDDRIGLASHRSRENASE